MSSHSEACRANSRQCLEIAEKTSTSEDKGEFLTFAATWQRLAKEIECNERLIALIDDLATNSRGTAQILETFADDSSALSLRRLATAIVSLSSHFVADHFASGVEEFDNPNERRAGR
jgi:hypothetical protein